MSSQGFFRFAAADTASETFRPRAISFVMAAGLVSAVIGPQLVKVTSEMMVVPFMRHLHHRHREINIIGSALFLLLDIPRPVAEEDQLDAGRSRLELIRTPRIAVAIVVAMVFICVDEPDDDLDTACGLSDAGLRRPTRPTWSWHMCWPCMRPSFFTGHLINKFGVEKIMGTGLAILAAAGLVGLSGVELENFYLALVLLGIGWNFGFIGATTNAGQRPHACRKRQGSGNERHDRLWRRDGRVIGLEAA